MLSFVTEKNVNSEKDNQRLIKITEFLKKYNLAIFYDEIQVWDDPKMVETKLIWELKRNVSYFLNDNFKDNDDFFDYNKIKFTYGYFLNFKKQTITINFNYDSSSKSVDFTFKVYKLTSKKLIESINKKLIETKSFEYSEKNWESFSLIIDKANKYSKIILEKITPEIEIENKKINLNKYRLNFHSWNLEKSSLESFLKLNFNYNNWSEKIQYKVILRPRIKINKIVEFLSKNNYLTKKITEKISWKAIEKIVEIANSFKDNFNTLWKLLTSNFYFENEQFVLQKNSINKIGPFDNSTKALFQLNNYHKFLPLKIDFNPEISASDLDKLQNFLSNKFAKIVFNKNKLLNYDQSKIMKLINKIINHQIEIDEQIVPFNQELLFISKKIENNQIIFNTKLKEREKNLSITLKLSELI